MDSFFPFFSNYYYFLCYPHLVFLCEALLMASSGEFVNSGAYIYKHVGLLEVMLLFPEMLSLDSCVPCVFSSIRSLFKCIISEAFHDHLIYNWNLPTSLTPFSFLFFILEFITCTLCYIYLSDFCFSLTMFTNRFCLFYLHM